MQKKSIYREMFDSGWRNINGSWASPEQIKGLIMTKKLDFLNELRSLLNRHSMENGSDTPDFVLAKYLYACLMAYEQAVEDRQNALKGDAINLKFRKKSEPKRMFIDEIDTPPFKTLDI